MILVSLDGAAAEDLHRFHREGEFAELRGFRRFFEEGQVASALIPVDPTLTAPNHASLSTGVPPARHGIVSNSLHRLGDPVGETVSGFDLPLESEALWEAARRQGKRSVSLTWPFAHGNGEGGRAADYGVLYVNDPEAEARIVDVDRAAWGEPDHNPARNAYSPVRMARITTAGAGGAAVQVRLYALDQSDDGRVNYDAIEVWPEVAGVEPRLLERGGGWAKVFFDRPNVREDEGWAVSHAKLLDLAPDLARARIYLGGVFRTRAFPLGYLLKLQRAGLYWPGAPDDDHLDAFWAGRPGIDEATWLEQAENLAYFYDILKALLFGPDDWELALLYLPHIDEAGHQFYLASPRQPGYDPERVVELEKARRAAWRMVDGLFAHLFAVEAMADTAVVVVSDHGMHPLHSTLDPNVVLRQEGLQAADEKRRPVAAGTAAWAVTSSAMAHVYLTVPDTERAPLADRLRRLFAKLEVGGERPVARVVTRKEAGALGLDHPNAGDLILFATPGWLFGKLDSGAATGPADHLGAHGYLHSEPRMRGIYLALGPGVTPGRIGTVRTVEVAGRVAALLGIDPPQPLPSMPMPPPE